MSKIDSGPAFPVVYELVKTSQGYDVNSGDGMSLRDYFAAAAMQGIIAQRYSGGATISEAAYALADEMLAERNKS